jgi:catechol 2,3-dioxygenase-like lactoylglutathione lyase family enzyme
VLQPARLGGLVAPLSMTSDLSRGSHRPARFARRTRPEPPPAAASRPTTTRRPRQTDGDSEIIDVGNHAGVSRENERGARMNDPSNTGQGNWPGGIAAITLFVEDLEAARRFYEEVFRLPLHYRDDNSAVFKFGETLINLLQVSQAPGLIAPAPVASPDGGVRFQFTLDVDDVDAMCDVLEKRGVELLNGPMDRPWGIRTASFRDPGGHIWEIAQ